MAHHTDAVSSLKLKTLGTSIVFVLGRNLLTIPIGFITVIVLARALNPEQLGQYNLALLLPLLLSTFLNCGIAPANIFLLGRNHLQLRQAYRATFLLWTLISLAGLFAGAGIIATLASPLFPGVEPLLLWIALISFPVTLLYNYWLSIIRGLQTFQDFNLATILTPAATLLFLLLEQITTRAGVLGALVAYNLGQLFGLLFVWYRLNRIFTKRPDAHDPASTNSYIRESLSYGWRANLNNIISFLNYRVDLLLINILLSTSSVGLYFAAARLVDLLWTPVMAASIVLLPRIAELHDNEEGRAAITPVVLRWTFLVTLLLALGMVVAGPIGFRLLGEEYAASYPILVILLPGAVLISISKLLVNDIAARGHPGLNVYTAISTFVIEITLILMLAGPLQLPGVALASSIAYSSQAFVSLALYLRLARLPLRAVLLPNELDRKIIEQGIRRLRPRASNIR